MAIARVSVLTGHVLGAMIQTGLTVLVSIGVALALGFRSPASVADWLGATGILVAFAFALTWLTVALGLVSKSVETASNLPIVLVFLPSHRAAVEGIARTMVPALLSIAYAIIIIPALFGGGGTGSRTRAP